MKPGGLLLSLGKVSKDKSDSSSDDIGKAAGEDADDDGGDDFDSLVSTFVDAVKSGDTKAAKLALKGAIMACNSEDY